MKKRFWVEVKIDKDAPLIGMLLVPGEITEYGIEAWKGKVLVFGFTIIHLNLYFGDWVNE